MQMVFPIGCKLANSPKSLQATASVSLEAFSVELPSEGRNAGLMIVGFKTQSGNTLEKYQ
jgi:hypothetical protein